MEKILKSIYSDPGKVGLFSGIDQLYRQAKKKIPNLTKHDVEEFLSSQDSYTLHRNVIRKFKTNKIISESKHQYWQADLSDMSRYASHNNGTRFILFVIDVHTRYLWLRSLLNKKSASVKAALESTFKESGTQPAYLNCDKGAEFITGNTKEMLEERHIGVIHTYSPSKAAIAERVQRTIKSKILKYFTYKNTYRYIDILQKFAESYNATHHSTLKMSPNKAYNLNRSRKHMQAKPIVRERKKFSVGSHVRVSRPESKFAKGYWKKWSEEIFKIKKVSKLHKEVMYYLVDLNNKAIDGAFYSYELQKVILPKEFKIDKILKVFGSTKQHRGKRFLVSWVGYPSDFNSIVTEKDILTI